MGQVLMLIETDCTYTVVWRASRGPNKMRERVSTFLCSLSPFITHIDFHIALIPYLHSISFFLPLYLLQSHAWYDIERNQTSLVKIFLVTTHLDGIQPLMGIAEWKEIWRGVAQERLRWSAKEADSKNPSYQPTSVDNTCKVRVMRGIPYSGAKLLYLFFMTWFLKSHLDGRMFLDYLSSLFCLKTIHPT